MKKIVLISGLVVLASSVFAQNLVTNGSFESEDATVVANNTGILGVDLPPTGWTFNASDLNSFSLEENNADPTRPEDPETLNPINAEDGSWYVTLEGYSNDPTASPTSEADYDQLSQAIQTTAGTTYNLSYYLYLTGNGQISGNTGDFFNATWNGNVIAGTQITNNLNSTQGWVLEQATVVGDGSMDTLGLHGFNNIEYVGVDNVVLTAQAVPEPAPFVLMGLAALALLVRRRNA